MNHPIVFRATITATIVLGTAGFVLAVLLWRQLRFTRPGRVAFVLAVAIAAFVTQHAVLLLADPAPHLIELSRSVVLGVLLLLVGGTIYARHRRSIGGFRRG